MIRYTISIIEKMGLLMPEKNHSNRHKQTSKHTHIPADNLAIPPKKNDFVALCDIIRQEQPINHLSPTEIMALQRTLGNQQMLTIRDQNLSYIARQPDAPVATATGLLPPAQVESAIAYHMSQPWRYTADIIMQIQTEVGTPPTGRMTAVDVQAVAQRQQQMNDAGEKPLLAVDGKAGPRTLPSVFKIGLAQDEAIADYSTKAKDLLANQGDKTDEQVALELCAEVNKSLQAQNIPPLNFETKEDIGGRGVFRASEWKLLLSPRQFHEEKLKDMTQTTSTIYHEARHAEQAYRVAQMLAGKKHTASQIVIKTGLNPAIAAIAAQEENHLQAGTMEAVIAEGWYDSLYSDAGKKKIHQNNAEMDKAYAEREAAQQAFDANPTPENQAKLDVAKAAYQKTLDAHKDMPHEFDAERVEDKVEKQLDEPD